MQWVSREMTQLPTLPVTCLRIPEGQQVSLEITSFDIGTVRSSLLCSEPPQLSRIHITWLHLPEWLLLLGRAMGSFEGYSKTKLLCWEVRVSENSQPFQAKPPSHRKGRLSLMNLWEVDCSFLLAGVMWPVTRILSVQPKCLVMKAKTKIT
jgi:hypothetical protein